MCLGTIIEDKLPNNEDEQFSVHREPTSSYSPSYKDNINDSYRCCENENYPNQGCSRWDDTSNTDSDDCYGSSNRTASTAQCDYNKDSANMSTCGIWNDFHNGCRQLDDFRTFNYQRNALSTSRCPTMTPKKECCKRIQHDQRDMNPQWVVDCNCDCDLRKPNYSCECEIRDASTQKSKDESDIQVIDTLDNTKKCTCEELSATKREGRGKSKDHHVLELIDTHPTDLSSISYEIYLDQHIKPMKVERSVDAPKRDLPMEETIDETFNNIDESTNPYFTNSTTNSRKVRQCGRILTADPGADKNIIEYVENTSPSRVCTNLVTTIHEMEDVTNFGKGLSCDEPSRYDSNDQTSEHDLSHLQASKDIDFESRKFVDESNRLEVISKNVAHEHVKKVVKQIKSRPDSPNEGDGQLQMINRAVSALRSLKDYDIDRIIAQSQHGGSKSNNIYHIGNPENSV